MKVGQDYIAYQRRFNQGNQAMKTLDYIAYLWLGSSLGIILSFSFELLLKGVK